jgi:hypothetical protein
VVDARENTIMLWPPSCAHDPIRQFVAAVLQPSRLDLGQESAELANYICALKVGRKSLEVAEAIASWAYRSFANSILSALA